MGWGDVPAVWHVVKERVVDVVVLTAAVEGHGGARVACGRGRPPSWQGGGRGRPLEPGCERAAYCLGARAGEEEGHGEGGKQQQEEDE